MGFNVLRDILGWAKSTNGFGIFYFEIVVPSKSCFSQGFLKIEWHIGLYSWLVGWWPTNGNLEIMSFGILTWFMCSQTPLCYSWYAAPLCTAADSKYMEKGKGRNATRKKSISVERQLSITLLALLLLPGRNRSVCGMPPGIRMPYAKMCELTYSGIV